MKRAWKPLVSLEIRHGWYPQGIALDVVLVPTDRTRRQLRGLRLLVRRDGSGRLVILYPSLAEDQALPMVEIKGPLDLDFFIKWPAPWLPSLSGLGPHPEGLLDPIWLFTRTGGNATLSAESARWLFQDLRIDPPAAGSREVILRRRDPELDAQGVAVRAVAIQSVLTAPTSPADPIPFDLRDLSEGPYDLLIDDGAHPPPLPTWKGLEVRRPWGLVHLRFAEGALLDLAAPPTFVADLDKRIESLMVYVVLSTPIKDGTNLPDYRIRYVDPDLGAGEVRPVYVPSHAGMKGLLGFALPASPLRMVPRGDLSLVRMVGGAPSVVLERLPQPPPHSLHPEIFTYI